MTILKTWTIAALDCAPSEDGHTNVAKTAHWRLNGTDGTHNASVYSTIPMGPVGESFTAFASLTEAQVVDWVKNALGEEAVAAAEASIDSQIAALATPVSVTPPLPWIG